MAKRPKLEFTPYEPPETWNIDHVYDMQLTRELFGNEETCDIRIQAVSLRERFAAEDHPDPKAMSKLARASILNLDEIPNHFSKDALEVAWSFFDHARLKEWATSLTSTDSPPDDDQPGSES